MHETRFRDLKALRMGSATGYVYCHQGCCEHALYFRDLRRIHPDDPQDASQYPVLLYQVLPGTLCVPMHMPILVKSVCHRFCAKDLGACCHKCTSAKVKKHRQAA
jgi:hypothetical protein